MKPFYAILDLSSASHFISLCNMSLMAARPEWREGIEASGVSFLKSVCPVFCASAIEMTWISCTWVSFGELQVITELYSLLSWQAQCRIHPTQGSLCRNCSSVTRDNPAEWNGWFWEDISHGHWISLRWELFLYYINYHLFVYEASLLLWLLFVDRPWCVVLG